MTRRGLGSGPYASSSRARLRARLAIVVVERPFLDRKVELHLSHYLIKEITYERSKDALVGTLILAGSAAIAVSVLLPAPRGYPGALGPTRSNPPGSGTRPTPDVFFPPLPRRAAALEPHPTGSHHATPGRTSFSTTRSPFHSRLRLLPMPRPDDGRHVRVGVKRQPRRRSAAGSIVPGQGDHRRAMAYPYAAFSPVGRTSTLRLRQRGVGGTFWDGRTPDSLLDRRPRPQCPAHLFGRDEQYRHQRGLSPDLRGLFRPSYVSEGQAKYEAQIHSRLGL